MSRNKVVVEEGVVRVITVGIQGPPESVSRRPTSTPATRPRANALITQELSPPQPFQTSTPPPMPGYKFRRAWRTESPLWALTPRSPVTSCQLSPLLTHSRWPRRLRCLP